MYFSNGESMKTSQIKHCIVLLATTMLVGCQHLPLKQDSQLAALSTPERELFEQATAMREKGRTDDAIQLYMKAAQISTGAVEAHVAAAEILRAENRAAEAMPMLKEALNLQPNDARLHMESGFALISQAKYVESVQAFDDAIRLNADLGSAYSGKAVAFDLQGKHEDAQQIYAEATARGLNSASLDSNYALSLVFTGKYDEAISLLKPHADAVGATATMRQNLALAYGLKGDIARAQEYAEADLDSTKARENLEFYKRYAALKKQKNGAAIQVQSVPTQSAVPVAPVLQRDVGFSTGEDDTEVINQPNVEVIEIDDEEFNALPK
jgi:Flp pilus assembly protein TadD